VIAKFELLRAMIVRKIGGGDPVYNVACGVESRLAEAVNAISRN
jgi:hypothetical protein